MAHPFEKLFMKALKDSSELDNQVLSEAEALLEKGYSGREIALVLSGLKKGLIDKGEAAVVAEASLEFDHYLED